MKKTWLALSIVGVLTWIVIGWVVLSGPKPEIIVAAEIIVHGPSSIVGSWHITNTMITAWAVIIFLGITTWLATRSMKLLPNGAQNFVEGSLEFLVNQVEDIAGREKGRHFFTVIATFFIFILVSNWFGLLPFFNAIGITEDVGHHVFHEIEEAHEHNENFEETTRFGAFVMEESGGVGLVPIRVRGIDNPGDAAADFEIEKGLSGAQALDHYVVFLATTFVDDFKLSSHENHELTEADVQAALTALNNSATTPNIILDEHHAHGVPSALLGNAMFVSAIDFPGEKLALVVPVFRSVYSDVNNTLALALISFFIVEFWGLQALGFGYLKKFFNFSSPLNTFVGLLELLSEFIRVLSFAFRLFGNIFAGEVLILMLTFLIPFVIVDIIYGLELFVGFIQAAVFALLTLVFAMMAVEHHDDEEHDENAAPEKEGTSI